MDFTLCLTHDCNLQCAYCYAGRKFKQSMSWDTAKQAIDFVFEYSIRRAALLHNPPDAVLGYFGGEPLLEWDLLQRSADYAIAEAIRKGIALKKTLTTNMTLMDDARFDWLCARGFYLGFSIDGNAAMHNTLRRFPDGSDSHAACERALQYITGPTPRGEVIVVVDPRNVQHLEDSVDWLLSADIRNIALNPNFYIRWPNDAKARWQAAYERIGDLYIQCYRNRKPARINFIDGKIRVRIKEGYAACDKCGFGKNEIAISASGNIYPCERIVGDDTSEKFRIGNVYTGFSKKRAQIIASRGNKVPECLDCSLRERCMNWCSCINYQTTGNISIVDGLVCLHERISIAVADRVGAALFKEANPSFIAAFYAI
jgi:uncharacterized protein